MTDEFNVTDPYEFDSSSSYPDVLDDWNLLAYRFPRYRYLTIEKMINAISGVQSFIGTSEHLNISTTDTVTALSASLALSISDLSASLSEEATAREDGDTGEAAARAAAIQAVISSLGTASSRPDSYFDIAGSASAAQTAAIAASDPAGSAAAVSTTTIGAIPLSQKAAASGVASLDSNSVIFTSQLPALALVKPNAVVSQIEMLALAAQTGDVAIRSDTGKTYMLAASPASTLSNWLELPAIGDITSVNGQQGVVVLGPADVGADPAGAAAAAQIAAIATAASDATTKANAAQAAAIAADKTVGTTTGTVAAGNDSRIVNAIQNTGLVIDPFGSIGLGILYNVNDAKALQISNYHGVLTLAGSGGVFITDNQETGSPGIVLDSPVRTTDYMMTLNAGLTVIGGTETDALNVGGVAVVVSNDSRLTNTRTPSTGSITDAMIATTLSPSKITGTAATLGANTFTGDQAITSLASASALLTVKGGTASSTGPYIAFKRGSVDKGFLGTESAINGGGSNGMTLYGVTSPIKIQLGATVVASFATAGATLTGAATVANSTTDSIPLTVNAITGQTAKLQSWQVNASEVASVSSVGTGVFTNGIVANTATGYALQINDSTGVTPRGYIYASATQFQIDTQNSSPMQFLWQGTVVLALVSGLFTVTDANHIAVGTTTGTKIGTSTTQKLGFFNATPIVQPTGDVITALQNLGLVASATISGALPTQTGNSGKYLTTDGTTASWGTVTSGVSSVSPSFTSSRQNNTGSTEMVNAGWTVGAGWSVAGSVLTHTAGNTATISQTLTGSIVSGAYYMMTTTITGRTAGSVTIDFGGISGFSANNTALSANVTVTNYEFTTSTDAVLTITPGTTFDGAISISIKTILPPLPAASFSSGGLRIVDDVSGALASIAIGKNVQTQLIPGAPGTLANTSLAIGSNIQNGFSAGYNNIGIGNTIQNGNMTGSGNLAIGNLLLQAVTSGSTNIAIGATSLSAITDGVNNIGIGADVLTTTPSGVQNIGIGTSVLNHATSATSDNTVVGYHGCMNTTSMGKSVVIGSQAISTGVATSAANGAIAIGYQALLALTTGAGNTAIGYTAASSIVTGSYNTAVGYQTMMSATTVGATAVGYQAIGNVATSAAVGATAVGYQALFALTTGANNTAVGYQSQTLVTTGNENTSLGALALSSLVSGARNTAVGKWALKIATSNNNTAVGEGALAAVTTGGANTAVGEAAGSVIGTGGIGNSFLGYNATSNSSARSYATAIGCSTNANADGAVALGTDSGGTGALTAVANEIKLGTANHTVTAGGGYKSADPGSGQGVWKLGKLITATVAADVTRYVEVMIDGVLYKLIVSS